MNAKKIISLVVVLLIGVAAVIYFRRPAPAVPPSAATLPKAGVPNPLGKDKLGRFANMSAEALMRNRPQMHASKVYPPVTPEEVEMWQWWNAIDKADPSFEWKMPIEFYGKVVDQNEQPVADAKVAWTVSVVGGSQKGSTASDADGRFALTGLIGKGITVTISKKGYREGKESRGDFEYAAFHEDGFHVPDSGQPVVFHLRKLNAPEPMYLTRIQGDLADDGTPVRLDLRSGKVVTDGNGDLVVKLTRHERPASHFTGYTVSVEIGGGGGLVTNKDEFMFSAPETGYQPGLTIDQAARRDEQDFSFRTTQELRFYVRTSAGNYAAVTGRVTQFGTPSGAFEFLVYYNPSGSRNLEFDYKKKLPTPER